MKKQVGTKVGVTHLGPLNQNWGDWYLVKQLLHFSFLIPVYYTVDVYLYFTYKRLKVRDVVHVVTPPAKPPIVARKTERRQVQLSVFYFCSISLYSLHFKHQQYKTVRYRGGFLPRAMNCISRP